MPRLQPPKGYYTATEVKKILNISDSMIRSYAQKGIIKYTLPPGRKHGFYSKRDVDNLANELSAFLSMKEAEEEGIDKRVTFTTATQNDMLAIVRMGREIFSPDSDRPIEIPAWQLKALEKNPELSFVLKKDGQLLGYVNIVPFTVNNEKAEKCLTVEFLSDVNITPDDIETFDTGNHIHLYIMALCVNPALRNADRRTYGGRLVGRFISKIKELGARGVVIEKVTARGDTHSGIKLLQAFGFHELPPPIQGKRAFILEMEKSFGHVSTQYQEALTEWKQRYNGYSSS